MKKEQKENYIKKEQKIEEAKTVISVGDEKKKTYLGWACIVLGGLFVLAGMILFILSNQMSLQSRKADATILGMYEIETPDGSIHTMVELSYSVGTELVMTSYEYPGVLKEENYELEIYYNIKEPAMIVEAAWSFDMLLVVVLGVLLLVPGLYIKGFLKTDLLKAPDVKNGSKKFAKELYVARQSVIEGSLPMLAGVLFIAFGIVMVIGDNGWWPWVFICVGAIELLYVGMEFVPALITWIQLSKVDKYTGKAKVYDVEVSDDTPNSLQNK